VPTARPTTRRKAKSAGIHLGVVCNWNEDRGFGFVRPDSAASIAGLNRDTDLYFHASGLKAVSPGPPPSPRLHKGDRIAFDVSASKRKTGGEIEAVNITIIEDQS
jgi:cold shock CspA family protein